MKVYALIEHFPYEGDDLIGVFSSSKVAENILKIEFDKNGEYNEYPYDYDSLEIQEVEIDIPNPRMDDILNNLKEAKESK